MYHLDDNIAAIASARGSAPRGIVRASGPTILATLGPAFRSFGPHGTALNLRQLTRPARIDATLALSSTTVPLQGALYVWPNARSYTGEPLVEWHTLGSPPLLEASLRTICQAGARLAEPGEFTLRAFLAGRLDLTQAEAVLGVIDARDASDLSTALSQLAGGLAQPLAQVRHDLVDLLVDIEAGLDFVEEDINFTSTDDVQRRLAAAFERVATVAAQLATRSDNRDLPRVVLRGWPNTGKSSLFNALSTRTAALVSETAGTTRDYLETSISCGSIAVRLIDTAGAMPEATPDVERAAHQATQRQVEQAEIELFCIDAGRELNRWEIEVLHTSASSERIVVLTKADAVSSGNCDRQLQKCPDAEITSSQTGEGLDRLRQRIGNTLAAASPSGSAVAATARRSREAIDRASAALATAGDIASANLGDELLAAEIRAALDALGSVVGAVYTDELLDGIFSRFCIGK